MAQEALEQECEKRGIEIKVETQGGMGIDNELEQDEIDEADVVIFVVLTKNVTKIKSSKLTQVMQLKILKI